MAKESFNRIQVLDHGYIRVIEYWGMGDAATDEAGIVEAARQSTGKGFYGWEPNPEIAGHKGDANLLKFLYSNKHYTPFEMAGMIIEVQAPIFVFREWHRHRTQSYNEMSARYIPLPDVNYVPSIQRLKVMSTTNKQAQGVAALGDDLELDVWLEQLQFLYATIERHYQKGLNLGIPKEIARLPIPVARYSRMRASANLRNWLAFLTLRMDPAAQWEIRQYAGALGHIISEYFPRTWKLFEEFK